ncbi:transposase family protein [Streptomyces griseoincarnatus]
MVGNASRAALISDRRITGLSADVITELVAELGPLWHERHQDRLASKPRKRAIRAGRSGPLHHHPRRRRGTATARRAWLHRQSRSAVADPGRGRRPPRRQRKDRHHRRHRDPGPSAGRRTQGPGQVHIRKNKQNAVKTMVVTDGDVRVLFCSPARPGSCADVTHARQLGLIKLLIDGPAVEILADAGYQDLGAQTGGRVITPPHREFKKNAPDWYEEMHERQRKAHASRRIRVEHGIAHLKNWRTLTRHLGRREHMSHTVQAIAGLLSHQQTADLAWARQL